MLDQYGRITIITEVLEKAMYLRKGEKVKIFLEMEPKRLHLTPRESIGYFLGSCTIDEKGRIVIPLQIRRAFPNSTFLPAEMGGEIYILIIDQRTKPE